MKKGKIFPAIIYFLFTFIVGFVLGLILPAAYLYSNVLLDTLSDTLYNGEYEEAIKLAGGYYNQDIVFAGDLDSEKSKIIIYQSITLNDQIPTGMSLTDEQKKNASFLHCSYIVFLTGMNDRFGDYQNEKSKAKIVVTIGDTQKDYLLFKDGSDEDKNPDYNPTYHEKGIVLLEFMEQDYVGASKLEFLNSDGEIFATFNFSEQLDYQKQFFLDAKPLVEMFNQMNANPQQTTQTQLTSGCRGCGMANREPSEQEKQLLQAEAEFLNLNTKYKKGTYERAEREADKQATKTVIIYFVIVYVLADFIFTRFIIKFVKFLLFKVFKIKPRKTKKKEEQSFGGDYYCAVTIMADKETLGEFDGQITITYGALGQFNFVLNADNGYESYQRIKAGNYGHLAVEKPDGYEIEGLEQELVVEGYKKTIIVKIVKRED